MSFISYEQFGLNFVALAVTTERIEEAVATVAGNSFMIGPMGAGPGGVAVVKADGRIGAPKVQQVAGPLLKFEARLPIELNLEIRLATVPQRYRGEVEVPLTLTVRTAEPLTLTIEVDPIAAADVHVDLRSSGVSAGMLQRLGNMDEEVRSQVARVVTERVSSPEARASREIDVAALIEKALSPEAAERSADPT